MTTRMEYAERTWGVLSVTLPANMITDEEVKCLKAKGMIGDFLGHFFNDKGKFVETELDARLVSIPLDTLSKIPQKVDDKYACHGREYWKEYTGEWKVLSLKNR